MNDFIFKNKAYDLLLSLKEDNIIKQTVPLINNVQDLRLAIDIVKVAYPLYANTDNNTMIEFIKDIFSEKPTELEITKANHEIEQYRPVKIQEIKPGVNLKIQENNHHYYHTFWTYEDTGKVISLENTTLHNYSQAFLYIWEKAKKGKVFIKNTFTHRIGDTIFHIDDPSSKGIIKGRMMFEPNQYSVIWENTGNNNDVPLTYWFNENILINKTKLEAMPMKTNEIIKATKNVNVLFKVSYLEWEQELYDDLIKQYNFTPEQLNKQLPDSGWVYKEISVPADRHAKSVYKTIRKHLRDNLPTVIYKDIKILNNFIKLKKVQKYNKTKQVVTINDKLVCVKHFPTNFVSRIPQSEAKELTERNNDYGYINKKEWRKWRNEISINRKVNKLNPIKPEKPDPKYTTIGGTKGIGNSPIVEGIVRNSRRAHTKLRKHSRLVKEQIVLKIVPEETISIKSQQPTLIMYDENNNQSKEFFETKIIKPAHTLFKRILTRIQPHKEIKLTEEVKLQRAERSIIDRTNHAAIRGLKPLIDLKGDFLTEERRNSKFSTVEKWSNTFEELVIAITQHRLFENNKFVANIHKNGLLSVIELILKNNNLKWVDEKIKDFIRYIRLTTHGVFGEKTKYKRPDTHKKLSKIKKPVQSVEFETTKTATRIDYTKLKQNLPEENKVIQIKFKDDYGEFEKTAMFKDGNMCTSTGDFLCQLRDVIAWKYKKDKDYQDIIIDEGGGITKMGIKFRRKDPEYLTKYFARMKKHKDRQKSKKLKNGKN